MNLYSYQEAAVSKLRSGSILCGGVGSGKSLTALSYFVRKESGQKLYIITTARKRDTKEWWDEIDKFSHIWCEAVDSWNNIKKYEDVVGGFFIFDEQRVVGSGSWTKSFLKITKNNRWILLSATPGDTWMDYIPVFIANGYYRNRTQFIRRHVVYNPKVKFPKIDRYLEEDHLQYLKEKTLVMMDYERKATIHKEIIVPAFNNALYFNIMKKRWNPWEDVPVQNISELCYLARRALNSDPSRLKAVRKILEKHPKVIIFYNFDYELEILKNLSDTVLVAEWNGHKHESIPIGNRWVYLVQYTAGAEGWNCIETNTIIFYSLNYSYKATKQAAGRIDRLNTPFSNLYYYGFQSVAPMDIAIGKALDAKRDFNEKSFIFPSSPKKHSL